jgi:undecaprenyl-diphosphatase
MMAAVTYLTLAALIASVQPRRRLKVYILALAVLLTFAVGVSRVYLGVHWPTDVLAGWAAGAGWALACLGIAQWLQRRVAIDPVAGPSHADAAPASARAPGGGPAARPPGQSGAKAALAFLSCSRQ